MDKKKCDIENRFARRAISIILLSAALLGPSRATATQGTKSGHSTPARAAASALADAKRTFAKARFNKPGQLDPSRTAHEFAPLIVEEVRASQVKATRTMGFAESDSKRSIFEPDTVYVQTGQVRAHDQVLDQVVFVWAYKKSIINPNDEKPPILVRGIRVVLGADGMPILWEALVGPAHSRIFFVSQGIEKAAHAQFGEPPKSRSFCVEQTSGGVRDVIVAGTVEDGPVPMGPYVYVDNRNDRMITTIHCRCSPSQFDEVLATNEYRLLPVESLDAAWLREQAGIALEKWLECAPLETLFRWPKSQP